MPAYPYPLQNQYPQYPPQAQQSYVTQPQILQPQQSQFLSNQLSPRPTQLPAHPIPNPNNKVAQLAYNVELHNFPTYMITPFDLNDIHLTLGKLIRQDSPIIIEEQFKEATPNHTSNNNSCDAINQTFPSTTDQPQLSIYPPFPERLKLDKQIKQFEYNLLDELNNVYIKISLLQAIKKIPIYAKTIKESCLKKSRRKKKDPQTIQVIGKLVDLMLGKIFMEKYLIPLVLLLRSTSITLQLQTLQ
jgi:hypothetical protein